MWARWGVRDLHTHTRRSVRDRSAPHRIGERWASPWARQMGGGGRERGSRGWRLRDCAHDTSNLVNVIHGDVAVVHNWSGVGDKGRE